MTNSTPPHPWIERLKTVGTFVGTVAALVAAVGTTGKWALNEAMESRDKQVADLIAEVTALRGYVADLKSEAVNASSAAHATAQATRDRFSEHELVGAEMRGSLEALRTEVRVRHGETYSPSEGMPATSRASQIRLSAAASDRRIQRATDSVPTTAPLSGLSF